MDSAKPQTGELWTRLASGIEAGIVGGVAMLGLLVSESLWEGHVWWEVPNLLGSTFYGPRAFRSGPSMASLAGVALHFVITGTLGGLFGLVFGGVHQRARLVLWGVLASVSWYNVANVLFWPRINPWVPAASPRPGTVLSHLLLGACLGYMGQKHKAGEPPRSEPPPPPEHLTAAVLVQEPACEPEPALVPEPARVPDHPPLVLPPADPSAAGSPDAIE